MTFISVGAAVGFLSARPLWQKFTVTLSAIPIAIFCNVMRISVQGLLDHYVSQQLSENFAHQFVGMIMLIPAFLLILLVGWILDQIFLEEVDRRKLVTGPKLVRRTTTVAPVAVVVPRRNLGPRGSVPAAPYRPPTASGPSQKVPPPVGKSPAPVSPSMPAYPPPQKRAPRPPLAPGATPPPSIRLASRPQRIPPQQPKAPVPPSNSPKEAS